MEDKPAAGGREPSMFRRTSNVPAPSSGKKRGTSLRGAFKLPGGKKDVKRGDEGEARTQGSARTTPRAAGPLAADSAQAQPSRAQGGGAAGGPKSSRRPSLPRQLRPALEHSPEGEQQATPGPKNPKRRLFAAARPKPGSPAAGRKRRSAQLDEDEKLRRLMDAEVSGHQGKRRRLTTTTTMILIAVAVAVVVLGAPVLTMIGTWNEHRQVQLQLAQVQKEHDNLAREAEKWRNPDYLSAKARERLGYLRPGETRFQVVDPGKPYSDQRNRDALDTPPRPWFMQIVDSQVQAARPDAKDATEALTPGQPAQGATEVPDEPKKKKKKR